jgi:hypothetical protein
MKYYAHFGPATSSSASGTRPTIRDRLAGDLDELDLHWIVLSAAGERADEARASAEAFGAELDVQDFRDAFFRYGGEIKASTSTS